MLHTGILAAGTNMGKIAMWHTVKNKTGANIDGEKKWELSSPSVIQEPVLQLQVCASFIPSYYANSWPKFLTKAPCYKTILSSKSCSNYPIQTETISSHQNKYFLSFKILEFLVKTKRGPHAYCISIAFTCNMTVLSQNR